MNQFLTLLPYPQRLSLTGDHHILSANKVISLDVSSPGNLFSTAQLAQKALKQQARLRWSITGGSAFPDTQIGLSITIDSLGLKRQDYHLNINPEQILIKAGGEAGAFYGVQTFIQLLKQYGKTLPTLEIQDWPDLEVRGVLLDISRDKVPTMETLFNLVDLLASWKINQFQLYTEHTFAYQNHPEVWANASPITAEEIFLLNRYCQERFIDLVPNQNCFGHMTRWFAHQKYRPLAETEGGFTYTIADSPGGQLKIEYPSPFSLSPSNPGSLELIDSLFAELLPNFTSDLFNVNCDETFDLGLGKSKALCEAKGQGRVYLDFLQEIYKKVQTYGRRMQFWGDIVGNHPDLVPEIPREVIALEWGYEVEHPFAVKCQAFADSKIPFYVCPGTSSWNSLGGRVDNAKGNIRNAVEMGIKFMAEGMLVTDWGDYGHWQQLPISYPGLAYASGLGWACTQNVDMDLAMMLDKFAFEDRAGILGQIIIDIGNIYQQPGLLIPNNSILFWGMRIPLDRAGNPTIQEKVAAWTSDRQNFTNRLHETIESIDHISSKINNLDSSRPDKELINEEIHLTTNLLHHAAERLLFLCGVDSISKHVLEAQLDEILRSYRRTWLERNRPGGLVDSLKCMTGDSSPLDMAEWESILNLYASRTNPT
jgi:hexosaminidase